MKRISPFELIEPGFCFNCSNSLQELKISSTPASKPLFANLGAASPQRTKSKNQGPSPASSILLSFFNGCNGIEGKTNWLTASSKVSAL
jgi:hypothetical protein